jgi:hypothetical protein
MGTVEEEEGDLQEEIVYSLVDKRSIARRAGRPGE